MKRTLVCCHPYDKSFNAAIKNVIIDSHKDSGSQLKIFDLQEIQFDPVVFQEFTLLPLLTIRENACFAAKDKGMADNLLKRFKIWHLKVARLQKISGGERQRAAIYQALARGPRMPRAHRLGTGRRSASGGNCMNIGPYTLDDYLKLVKSFHGYLAPGLIVGGFMVDLAMHNLPENILFDAISETESCLPDAIQLLTLCTFGNGWLKVRNFGRYALSLYDKSTGSGVRVYLDARKLEDWPNIKDWYLKLKPKKEQDSERLRQEILEAGDSWTRTMSRAWDLRTQALLTCSTVRP